jgi:hypothetical protein
MLERRHEIWGVCSGLIAALIIISHSPARQNLPADDERPGALPARASFYRVPRLFQPPAVSILRERTMKASYTHPYDAPPPPEVQDLFDEVVRVSTMARYPRWSQPIELIGDPIANAQFVEPAESSGPENADPVLTVYAERNAFDAPEPIVLHAYLTQEGQYLPARAIVGTVRDGAGDLVTELTFAPDTASPTYSASFTPAKFERPNLGYTISVHATTAAGEEREAETVVIYNQPYAQLTGRFRDRIENGNLVIDAELVVDRSAVFRLEGSLYTEDGTRPLAWASASRELSVGTDWIPLTFYGLILRERTVSGPYLLRFASLSTETPDADATMRPIENAHVTPLLDARKFTREVFNDPELLAEATNLREQLDRLQRNPL